MKIAEVCPYDYHRTGGVQLHMHDLSRALIEAGHEVTVIAPQPSKIEPPEESMPRVIHVGKTRDVSFNHTHFEITKLDKEDDAKLAAILSEHDFDVIHYHTPWVMQLPLKILRLSKATNIATFHDTPPNTFGGMVTRNIFRGVGRVLSRRLHAAIAVSKAPARHLWLRQQCPLHIFPPCTDLSSYFELDSPAHDNNNEQPLILFLGRLETRKGAGVLIEAAHILAECGIKPKFVLAGDGPLRQELENQVRHWQLDNVSFIGHITETEKRHWLSVANIFCAPSLYGESFGIVLLEAMAAGVAVVAADNAGYRSTVEQTGGGLLAKAGSATALSAQLAVLVNNAALRSELARKGKKSAETFDAKAQAPIFIDLFKSALALKG